MRECWVLGARRTAFGAFGGMLRDIKASSLGAASSRAALAQSGVDPAEIDQVIFGNVVQSWRNDAYCARHVALEANLPIAVPALTVNRLCGSGFQALISAAQEIRTGDAQACLVGGTESMSAGPARRARSALGLPAGQGAAGRGSAVDHAHR